MGSRYQTTLGAPPLHSRAGRLTCLRLFAAGWIALSLTACQQASRLTQPPTATASAVASSTPAAASADAVLTRTTVTQIAKKSTPGIVQVTNERQVLQGSSRAVVPAGVGTGFVVDNLGHIVTNDHVIADAQRLEIQTTDGKTFPVKDESDLARILYEHKPGDTVTVTVAHGEGTEDVKVTLGAAPATG